MKRRSFLNASLVLGGAGSLGSQVACAAPAGGSGKARVVVVGGGYGGATAAKYVRWLSGYSIEVVLVEPNADFVSCPLSNLVLGGSKTMADITRPYDRLASQHGVTLARDSVATLDAAKKTVTLAGGSSLAYDKLILAPGVDMLWNSVEGLQAASAAGQVLQAWKAGPETLALRRQLEAMPDGGVFAIAIPEAPYRCPPGPYERACQAAHYFKQNKPNARVLVLDANPEITSKGALFRKAWAEDYKGLVEYRPQHKVVGVDVKTSTLQFEVQDDVKASVLNVLPSMSAGSIAVKSGLANANGRWCLVDFLTFESTAAKDVHVIGDAIQIAPAMPKSGHMANAHGKVTAAAVVAQLSGLAVDTAPMLVNTCYSYLSDKRVAHVASVHGYVAAEKTFKAVAGSGGLSPEANEQEATYATAWAQNIWMDTLG